MKDQNQGCLFHEDAKSVMNDWSLLVCDPLIPAQDGILS